MLSFLIRMVFEVIRNVLNMDDKNGIVLVVYRNFYVCLVLKR